MELIKKTRETLKQLKDFAESKRDSKNLFWRIVIFLKDICWFYFSGEFFLKIAYIFNGIYDYASEPPIISDKNYILLIDPKKFPEFSGGIFNPGCLNLDGDIILFARTEKYPMELMFKKERFINSCSPLLLGFNDKDFTRAKTIGIDYQQKGYHRMEDFRIFKFKNKIYSNFGLIIFTSDIFFIKPDFNLLEHEMLIGELDIENGSLKNISHIKTDFNVKKIEKNWVFFQNNNELYLIYSFSPYYRLMRLSDSKKWDFKTAIFRKNIFPFKNFYEKFISLSTNPIEYDENYFLLLVYYKNIQSLSYRFWGVLINKKTLLPEKITKKPLIKSPWLAWNGKQRIIYVSSVAKNADDFILFFGIEDKESFYAKINKKKLDSCWKDFY